MRLQLLYGLLAVFLMGRIAWATPSSEDTASIAGVVLGAESPLVVHLQSGDEDPTRYYDGYQVETDKDGKFLLDLIKPGSYRLWA